MSDVLNRFDIHDLYRLILLQF